MKNNENTPDYEAILDEMPEPDEEDLDKAMDDFIYVRGTKAQTSSSTPNTPNALTPGAAAIRAQLMTNYNQAMTARKTAKGTDGYAAAKTNFGMAARRLAEHHAGVGRDAPIPLPHDPHKYFDHTTDTHQVPLDKIVPVRARPEGIANAEPLMRLAYDGVSGRREPVSLEHNGDGTFSIKDGNSTYAIAEKHGWPYLPARVWDKGQWRDPKESSELQGRTMTPHEYHKAIRTHATDNFTHQAANTAPESDATTEVEDGIITLENGERYDPSKHSMRPGYLEVDDQLMIIRKLGDNPERYDKAKKQWVHYPNTAEAALHSNRLTEEEAREMAKKQGIPLD